MISPETTAAWAEAERLSAHFAAHGAEPVEAAILQPADLLLDLYGEDIRARAYVTSDPLRGEMMLRPDFTVPLVQMHMETGGDPARYTYAGEVFRRQEAATDRANEYLQVGYELFGGEDPAEGDAEVFAVIGGALEAPGLEARIGDWGLLVAAVRGLDTSDARKGALLRHIWRPARLRALLDRFGGVRPVPPTRAALLAREDPFAEAGPEIGPEIGLRSRTEVEARIAALRADAAEPPISGPERSGLEALLGLEAPAPEALERLRDLAGRLAIGPAVERMAARLTALAARGVATEALAFRASSGWTALEYYDGFVFGFFAPGHDQPVATGGRYDALTEALGGRRVPAVGGVVRPDLVVAARARA